MGVENTLIEPLHKIHIAMAKPITGEMAFLPTILELSTSLLSYNSSELGGDRQEIR